MLRAEDNQFLTESGAGTGMGELLRRFWLPVLLSEELPEADGPSMATTRTLSRASRRYRKSAQGLSGVL